MIKTKILLVIVTLFCSCASNVIRVPKEKGNRLTFVGNATAVTSIEDGKRIAFDDVLYQILFYIGVDASSFLYSNRINQSGITLEQMSFVSSAIIESAKIKKIKKINKRRVYTKKHGIFDVYDIQIYVEVDVSKINKLKEKVDKIQTNTVIREYSTTQNYSIPQNPVYKQLEENKAMLLYNDEDKYPNTIVTLPFGFRFESAAFSLLFPGLGQFLNNDDEKGYDYGSAEIMSLLFGYMGYPYCYAIGGVVWTLSVLDAYIYAENKYNSEQEIKEIK